MKKTNESKTWNINHYCGEITFKFSKSVDIRKAFEAMKAADTESESWLDHISFNDTNTVEIEWRLEIAEFVEITPAICKAIAETFSSDAFEGHAYFDDLRCYCVDEYDYAYDGETLRIKETFADDEIGYFCPDCGFQVAFWDDEFDDTEIECGDCEETFKVFDLKYVPPIVNKYEIKIG